MKVYFHEDFYQEYTSDPAAEPGRMEAIVQAISPHVQLIDFSPATQEDLLAAHPISHIEYVRNEGLYDIAALAAGGAIQAALTGMDEPAFGLIRPPGHHASADACWGFCYFNNLAVSLLHLRNSGKIETAFILDFDMHFGDGTVDILGRESWVEIFNPTAQQRHAYLDQVQRALEATQADVIAVSAGFDNHVEDWGELLETEDYGTMAGWVRQAARRNHGGCYGILEGGYKHRVLGANVLTFLKGLDQI